MQTTFAWLPWNIEGKARLYRCARKMSVMRLFSPDKLIDYSPSSDPSMSFIFSYQQDTYVLLSKKNHLSPRFLTFRRQEHGSAQRRTKRKDCLRPALRTYCRFTERTRLISLCVWSAICRACHCSLLRSPDFLCRVTMSRRTLGLQLVYTVHAYHV